MSNRHIADHTHPPQHCFCHNQVKEWLIGLINVIVQNRMDFSPNPSPNTVLHEFAQEFAIELEPLTESERKICQNCFDTYLSHSYVIFSILVHVCSSDYHIPMTKEILISRGFITPRIWYEDLKGQVDRIQTDVNQIKNDIQYLTNLFLAHFPEK